MTNTETAVADAQAPGSRTGIAIAGAVAILVVVTLVILLVGWVPVPDLPSLADSPDPTIPGSIAWLEDSGDGSCVNVSAASGANPRELTCLPNWTESIAWTTDGSIAITTYDEFGPRIHVLAADDGAVVETIALGHEDVMPPEGLPTREAVRADGTRVIPGDGFRADTEGTATLTTVAADGTRTTIVELSGPRDYAFRSSLWSPDGQWILVSDSRGRLIIVADDGDPGPRLLVDTGDDGRWDLRAAWLIPGDTTGTIDLDSIRHGAPANG